MPRWFAQELARPPRRLGQEYPEPDELPDELQPEHRDGFGLVRLRVRALAKRGSTFTPPTATGRGTLAMPLMVAGASGETNRAELLRREAEDLAILLGQTFIEE